MKRKGIFMRLKEFRKLEKDDVKGRGRYEG